MFTIHRMGGFLFLFLKRVRIWRKMAAEREQYGPAVRTAEVIAETSPT